MKTNYNNSLFLSFIIIFSAIIFAACGMRELESTWRDREITIDGIDEGTEWENARYFFDKEKVTIGLLNDENNMYVRISSRDLNMQRQLMALGFIVWFDQEYY